MVGRYKTRGLHHQLSAGCSPREEWLPYGRCRLLLSAASTDDVANFFELLYATQTFGFALYEELFLLSGADVSEGFTLADVNLVGEAVGFIKVCFSFLNTQKSLLDTRLIAEHRYTVKVDIALLIDERVASWRLTRGH